MLLAAQTPVRDGAVMAPRGLLGRFVRYGFASATGTVVDLVIFGGLIALSVWPGLAAAIGYACGTVWHWMVSSRLVFSDRLARPGRARRAQQVLFVASALLGLALTTAIVVTGTQAGLDPAIAKFLAMCAAFTSVWLVRLFFVFKPGEPDA